MGDAYSISIGYQWAAFCSCRSPCFTISVDEGFAAQLHYGLPLQNLPLSTSFVQPLRQGAFSRWPFKPIILYCFPLMMIPLASGFTDRSNCYSPTRFVMIDAGAGLPGTFHQTIVQRKRYSFYLRSFLNTCAFIFIGWDQPIQREISFHFASNTCRRSGYPGQLLLHH